MDTVKILLTPSPIVAVGPNISVCANNATIAVNGTVSAGTTTGLWSGTGSGVVYTFNNIIKYSLSIKSLRYSIRNFQYQINIYQ
ncbi:MAG: hypothetical protein IPH32_10140 [Bacteroidetes bacterium]|nr:hypothetical protein [Bacteroidota bacterium]